MPRALFSTIVWTSHVTRITPRFKSVSYLVSLVCVTLSDVIFRLSGICTENISGEMELETELVYANFSINLYLTRVHDSVNIVISKSMGKW